MVDTPSGSEIEVEEVDVKVLFDVLVRAIDRMSLNDPAILEANREFLVEAETMLIAEGTDSLDAARVTAWNCGVARSLSAVHAIARSMGIKVVMPPGWVD